MSIQSINPVTGNIISEYQEHSPASLSDICEKAQNAFLYWKKLSIKDRTKPMRVAAQILRENAEFYGRLMAEEMGKPLKEGIAEAQKCAWVCDYYAENAGTFLSGEHISTDASKSYVSYQPLGVILAVMPWNFPFWQVFRFAAPNLMAGNAGILKHASNVPGCAMEIEKIFLAAGFPDHLFQSVLIPGFRTDELIQNQFIRGVTLTGSTPVGRKVAGQAGKLLKKTVLELGGSDPYVILADADLDLAVDRCVTSRLLNTGQSCIAAKRFIIDRQVFNEFEQKFNVAMERKQYGEPLDSSSDIGPMARHDLRDELHQQVMKSVECGARLLTGGVVPPGPGAFYPPTVLSDVRSGMPAYDQELFGPVASLIKVDNEEEAIRVANDTCFGLGAAVFTADLARGERIARERLNAGSCFVNDFVRSDPRLPFGGIKDSGYGRELAGIGMHEFTNMKTVYIA